MVAAWIPGAVTVLEATPEEQRRIWDGESFAEVLFPEAVS